MAEDKLGLASAPSPSSGSQVLALLEHCAGGGNGRLAQEKCHVSELQRELWLTPAQAFPASLVSHTKQPDLGTVWDCLVSAVQSSSTQYEAH